MLLVFFLYTKQTFPYFFSNSIPNRSQHVILGMIQNKLLYSFRVSQFFPHDIREISNKPTSNMLVEEENQTVQRRCAVDIL